MDPPDEPEVNGGTDFSRKKEDLIEKVFVETCFKDMSETFVVHHAGFLSFSNCWRK
jgi:hypothetical protein